MSDWSELKPSVVFHCPDVADTIATLRKHGVKIVMEPNEMPWGQFATIEDPDGNAIGMTDQKISLQPETVGA